MERAYMHEDNTNIVQSLQDKIHYLEQELRESQLRLEAVLTQRLKDKEHFDQRINKFIYAIHCTIQTIQKDDRSRLLGNRRNITDSLSTIPAETIPI